MARVGARVLLAAAAAAVGSAAALNASACAPGMLFRGAAAAAGCERTGDAAWGTTPVGGGKNCAAGGTGYRTPDYYVLVRPVSSAWPTTSTSMRMSVHARARLVRASPAILAAIDAHAGGAGSGC